MSNSFHDIAGKTVDEGDFCLFRTSDDLKYGMLCGKSFINEKGYLYNFSKIYKLSNMLNTYEQKKRVDIQKAYNEYYLDKEAKKKILGIKAKDLEIGQAYTAVNKDVYIYLGHGSLTKTFSEDMKPATETGFIYIRVGYCSFNNYNNIDITHLYICRYLLTDMFLAPAEQWSIDVLRTRKKFIAKVDYKSPILEKNFKYEYSDEYGRYKSAIRHGKNINKSLFEFKLD